MFLSRTSARRTSPRRRPSLRPRAEVLEGRQLLTAGALDLSFGGAGWVAESPSDQASETFSDFGYDVAILEEGKILVGAVSHGRIGLVRLNADATLDTTFGTDGRVRTELHSSMSTRRMTVQPDGKIVVVGGVDNDAFVVRYHADGSLDAAFGDGGVLRADIKAYLGALPGDTSNETATSVAVQPDGRILLGGETSAGGTSGLRAFLVRYHADGSLDKDFGTEGVVISPLSRNFSAIALQADGKIVVRGGSGADLARFNADGTLDDGSAGDTTPGDSFGTGGVVISAALNSSSMMGHRDLAILGDGRIVALGTSGNGLNDDIGLLRVLPDGTPDPGFGVNGEVRIDLGREERSGGMTVLHDGSILVVGHQVNTAEDALIARLTPEGTLDPTFTSPLSATPGIVVLSFSTDRDEFFDVAVDPDGRIIAVGSLKRTVKGLTTDTDFLIARFQGDPSLSVPTPGFRVNTASGLVTTEAGGTATFTVALTARPTADVTIPVHSSNTAEGTVSTSSLTFTPENWDVPQVVTITGVDDDLTDGDVAYTIVLGTAISADPAYHGLDPFDVSVVNRDDEIPSAYLAINSVSIVEGNSGSKTMTFTVTRSGDLSRAIAVDFATEDGTATAGSDYAALIGTLHFAAGETTKTIAVTIFGDKLVEPDEWFLLRLLHASAGVELIGDGVGTGTILDDDSKPGGGKK